jgi:pimeloyl-ACP methyl ester carboxylesterase
MMKLVLVSAGALMLASALFSQGVGTDGYALFEQPGRMVRLTGGNRLSLYCSGAGKPAVVLETGFGGGAYADWHELQPRVARFTRVCSYDRAGYGFSELGNDLPRDIKHDVIDLHALLLASGEHGPYVLVGHSDGGHIIGAYTDLYPRDVAGLVFLDAAVLIDKQQVEGPYEPPSAETRRYYDGELKKIRGCLERAEHSHGRMLGGAGDFCLDTDTFQGLPPRMVEALEAIAARPDGWRAYLSEAEQHYLVDDDSWEISLLPHRWERLQVQVFTASVAALDDAHSAAAYGLRPEDHKAIAEAQAGRQQWEKLQARICELSRRCEAHVIPTAEHEVQNAVPDQVADAIRGVVLRLKGRGE